MEADGISLAVEVIHAVGDGLVEGVLVGAMVTACTPQ